MDSINDGANIIAEEEKEDRLNKLPEDILYHILGFLDMKHAIQTCALSKRWKHIWTSILQLNFNSHLFPTPAKFAKFATDALSHREKSREVFGVDITFKGLPTSFTVRRIVKYAFLHNVQKLSIVWFMRKLHEFPVTLFSSHTLKHLTLTANEEHCLLKHRHIGINNISFNFPALETLSLSNMHIYGNVESDINLDLFPKCVNLKELTLDKCFIYRVGSFNVYAPRLSNLTITDFVAFPKVFNVVAPQLKTLIATVSGTEFEHPRLIDSLHLTTNGFDSLDNVNLYLSIPKEKKEKYVPVLLNLFQKLRSAQFLVLNVDIIETLSSCLDQLSHEPCPFNNLKCLRITTGQKKCEAIPTQVRNYFLENSPSAAFIMELPQVPQKKSREQEHQAEMAKEEINVGRRKKRKQKLQHI